MRHAVPEYCRATPTECVPFKNSVSSTTESPSASIHRIECRASAHSPPSGYTRAAAAMRACRSSPLGQQLPSLVFDARKQSVEKKLQLSRRAVVQTTPSAPKAQAPKPATIPTTRPPTSSPPGTLWKKARTSLDPQLEPCRGCCCRRVDSRGCGGTRRTAWTRSLSAGRFPRMRGASIVPLFGGNLLGRSPRMRGSPIIGAVNVQPTWSIPAHAGEPALRRINVGST